MVVDTARIGTDIDGVLCDFGQGFINRSNEMGIQCCFPEDSSKIDKWMFPCGEHFKQVWDTVETDESFWLNLPPLRPAQEFFKSSLSFVPRMYITKRHVSSDVTREWLVKNGFPDSEVITVDDPKKKIQIVKQDCDIYVDDLVQTVVDMRKENINAILYAAPYQVSEDVSGLPIISDFRELFDGNYI
jgi:hypothetical protein